MVRGETPGPPDRLPRHVVLIPDGNGRWAEGQGRPVAEGHLQGARAVESFLRVCRDWNIPVATIWAFSTENWGRNEAEVTAIMRLVDLYLRKNRGRFKREQMRFRHLGRRDRIAARFPRLSGLITELEEETREHERYALNLALDYGGRDEVLRAIARLANERGPLADITWKDLERSLDTAGQPDPDLIIRTSGERRLSGILPLQSIYAELIFIPRFLPEMKALDFQEAFREFAARDRRFGTRPVSSVEKGTVE
ncbi:MAG: polyprenyl diphosphate synthase [Candidatus Eisenbacteria bacterium]